ncbi:hypothetical protein [Sulfurimonas sp.]
MNISVSGRVVTIVGNIKSINDYQALKDSLDSVTKNGKSIIINIEDSISITSSVIGYLTKLVQKDNIDVQIKVGDANLYELFDEINLVELFKVTKS